MIFLLATILLNTYIFSLFKLFERFNVDILQTIVVNYWVCVITGSFYQGQFPVTAESFSQQWFPWALGLGAGFISVFYLMAYCTRKDGITATTVTNKLSLVIPVFVSIFLYREGCGLLKLAGIALSFPAIYMTVKQPQANGTKTGNLLWLVVLFFLSGALDTTVKFAEHSYLHTPALQASFTSHIFAVAGILGTVVVALKSIAGKTTLQWKSLVFGILLGIPNYFSIYLFIRMLNSPFLPSSASIPANNIGIVVVSTIVAIFFFKEKVTLMRVIGLSLSIVSILLIAFS